MALHFTFKSLIHFEFIFVYSVRRWSNFISLHISVQFSNTIYWINYHYPITYFCLLCCRIIDHIGMDLFLGSLFLCIDLCVCFYDSTMLFWLLQLCSNFTESSMISPTLFFLHITVAIERLCGSIQILGLFVLVLWKRKCHWYFDRDYADYKFLSVIWIF